MDRRSSPRAFTLVELLVVIGIIAVLIGILLPSLSSARESSKAVACRSNLKQILTATFSYATAHKDSLPYGFTWNRINPTSPVAGPAVNLQWISWFTSVNKFMNAKAEYVAEPKPPYNFTTLLIPMNPAFRCPSAGPEFQQQVHYYNNGTAMPHLPNDVGFVYQAEPVPFQGANAFPPARTRDLWPDTALFWDTPLLSGMSPEQALPMFSIAPDTNSNRGWIPASYLDWGAAFVYPEEPATRYRPTPPNVVSAVRADDDPVSFFTEETLSGAVQENMNSDMGGDSILVAMIGGLRFRHSKNTVVNVAFADGSVQGLELNRKRRVNDYAAGPNGSYYNDFKVKYYRLKWPSNRKPAPVSRFP